MGGIGRSQRPSSSMLYGQIWACGHSYHCDLTWAQRPVQFFAMVLLFFSCSLLGERVDGWELVHALVLGALVRGRLFRGDIVVVALHYDLRGFEMQKTISRSVVEEKKVVRRLSLYGRGRKVGGSASGGRGAKGADGHGSGLGRKSDFLDGEMSSLCLR